MKRTFQIVVIFVVLMLAGCGVGGSSPEPAPSPKEITSYSLNGVVGTINEANKTIVVTMPNNTNVTALVATFVTTGQSVTVNGTVQISGTTTNNFTSPVTYTVHAADSSTAAYTVTVGVTYSTGYTSPVTGDATSILGTSATLNGSFTNPSGYTTTVWFEYGLTIAYGSTTPGNAYLSSGSIAYSANLASLTEATTYHFRLVTLNTDGTFYGLDQQFITPAAPVTLLSDLDAPVGLPFDGTYVYWMEIYSGRVRRLNVTNDTAATIASSMGFSGNSGGIAIDANYIYLTDGGAAIRRMNLDGSDLKNDFSTAAKSSPTQIVAHSTGLYIREEWLEWNSGDCIFHQTISRISLDGQTRSQLFERPGNVWGNGGCGTSGFGGGMVLDNDYIYWTDYYNNIVQRLSLSGGIPITITTTLSKPDQLLLDGSNLYISHEGGVSKFNLGQGSMTTAVSSNDPSAFGYMGKDNWFLYVLFPTEIKKIDLTTAVVTSLSISNQGTFTSQPVVTSNHLYWTTQGNHFYPPLGTLKEIVKP